MSGSELEPRVGPELFIKYLDLTQELWHIPEEDAIIAQQELENGGDGIIKMLLFAFYRHIQSIKFIKRGEENHTSLQWLTRAIGWSRTSGKWPPGFQSIRHVAVGVVSGTELDSHIVSRSAVDLAAILNLPSIDSVYFNDLSQDQERDDSEGEEETDDIPLGRDCLPRFSSSVRHIYLDSPRELTDSFREILFTAPEKLQTMAIKGCNFPEHELQLGDTDVIVDYLVHEYKDTMESLIFYNMYSGLHGYRCAVYEAEQLERWSKLKQFSIDIEALELYGYQKSWTSEEFLENFRTEELFPISMEVLMLWGIYDKPTHTRIEAGVEWFDVLEEMVVSLIKNKCRLYQQLKVIYIDCAEKSVSKQRSNLAFQKAITAGRESGVHVHTLTNMDDGGYWRRFPVAPDKFDLRTGSFGSRPSTWKINRFTGIWEEPGCEGCGECEECLQLYPEHLWKGLSLL